MQNSARSVDVVIPVYGAKSLTLRCIDSVTDSLPDNPTIRDIVVIYDAGPDPSLLEALLVKARTGSIVLIIHETNQGFVRSANRGMTYSTTRDVLLLNSDTEVSGDWVERMAAAAYSSENAGTVTPFSNNAEICSWPLICEDNPLPPNTTLAELNEAFRPLAGKTIELPTAVGFCMYIRRDCLERTGLFEPVFGAGYGEENDFCRRAAALGFTNLLACDVFVWHKGAASFGARKKSRVERAIQLMNERYPDYAALVASHIADDPARRWRFIAALNLMRNNRRPLILHISHGIGGGTDKHVVELSRNDSIGANHAMLVPYDKGLRLVFPGLSAAGLFNFPDLAVGELRDLLRVLNLQRVHIHHVKGWEERIGGLLQTLDMPYDITLHDYYFIHPNPALADSQGNFCGDAPDIESRCDEAVPLPSRYEGMAQWQQDWRPLLRKAQRIFSPTTACTAIYSRHFPDLHITEAFHPDHLSEGYPPVTLQALQPGEPLHVVVLGALSVIKGANILERTALLARTANAPIKFTLIGYAYKTLTPTITTTGPYADAQLAELLQDIKPHVVWFPCTWPETYSYTLSSSLAAGLPVLCSRIGAFPERIAGRPASWLADWQTSPEQWLDRLLKLRDAYSPVEQCLTWTQQPGPGFDYTREYLPASAVDAARLVEHSSVDWEHLTHYWCPELAPERTVRHRVFRILLWMQTHRWLGRIADLIPLPMRRSIKRKLTTRPLHE